MPKVAGKALAAIEATNPELVPVIEAAKFLQRRRQATQGPAELQVQAGGVVLIPPREKEPAIKFGKDRIRVLERKGVRIVQVDRAGGLSGGDLVALLALAGLGVAGYEAYRAIEAAVHAIEHPTFHLFPPGIY